MNITDELKKVQQKDLNFLKGEETLLEANNLLLNAHSEDKKVYQALGLKENSYTSKLKDDYLRTENAKKIYGRSSFTGAQIKELCIKYDLRILHMNEYNGKIPTDLAKKIIEFKERNNVTLDPNKFFILAPVEMFDTEKYVPPTLDPIVLYRSDEAFGAAEETHTFINLHDWGNDFTFLRKFRFLFSKYEDANNSLSNYYGMMILFAIYAVIMGIFLTIDQTPYMIYLLITCLSIASIWIKGATNHSKKLWNQNKV